MKYVITVHIVISLCVLLSPLFIVHAFRKQLHKPKEVERYVVNNITGEKVLVHGNTTKYMNCVLLSIVSCMMIVCFVTVVFPFMNDFCFILKNGVPKVSGVIAEDFAYSNKERVRENVIIEDSEGERIELNIEASHKKKGDYVTVEYLPNLRIGVIIN